MNKIRKSAVAMAAGLALTGAVAAQVLARSDYQERREAIASRLRAADAACAALAGQARAVCAAEAAAEDRIARSRLDARYRPSASARHHALVVAAEGRLAVALVRCGDLDRGARSECATQAEAVHASALADAGARLKAAQANARAAEQSMDDRTEAASDTFDARHDAAMFQCDGYQAGRTKDLCLVQTEGRFVRP